jgi:hypothetical protein
MADNDKNPSETETILMALDQISQTIDVMTSVVGRLRNYLQQQEAAALGSYPALIPGRLRPPCHSLFSRSPATAITVSRPRHLPPPAFPGTLDLHQWRFHPIALFSMYILIPGAKM